MTMDFAETLQVGDVTYGTFEFPLNACFDRLSLRPRLRAWPGCSNGYYASWEVQDRPEGRFLCMVELRPRAHESLALLFPCSAFPLPATGFSGVIRGVRDERRRTGYPPRTFWNEEIFLEVVVGQHPLGNRHAGAEDLEALHEAVPVRGIDVVRRSWPGVAA